MEIIKEGFLEETAAQLGFESSLCLLLKKILVITFKAHPEYPGDFPMLRCSSFNHQSAKSLLP